MSLTSSSAATPTQMTLLSPVMSTNILTSSSLISSAQTNQLSKSFTSSTELSKTTTASFSQSVATTIKRTSFNEFTLLSSSLSQSQLTSQTHHYTHMPSSSTELSTAQSMLIMTESPMLSSMTKSLSQTQSMMLVTYSSMPTVSLSQSTKSKVTSLSTISMSDSQIIQLGTSTVANFPPISLSTTGTSSQHLNSFFSTQEDIETTSQSQYKSSYAMQAMKTSFTVATPAPSYGLLSLSSSPSSTPSGDGGSFSQPVIASISGAAGFITLIVFAFVIIIIVGYLCGYVEPHCT